MKKVITYGTYDLLHFGHIRLLERAKTLGDYLIVGVTAEDFDKARGKINVVQSLTERIESVRKTGLVDEIVVEEYEGQKIDDILRYDVDIFAIGSDWMGKFDYLKEYCEVVYLDRTQGISSTELRAAKKQYKLGMVGSVSGMSRYAKEVPFVNGIELYSLYCTSGQGDLNEVFQNIKIADSYESLLNEVDAVYVVSHPSCHYDHVRMALMRNKHVLCESPITFSVGQTQELFDLAKSQGVVLMDSIKTAFSMAYERMLLLVKSGKIGEVISVDAVCTSLADLKDVNESNIREKWNSICAWGPTALLPIFQILGSDYVQKSVVSSILNKEYDFDRYTKLSFIFNKAVASVQVGKGIKSEGQLVVSGTKGYVYVPAPWWKTDYFEIRYENPADNRRYFYQLDGDGIRYELVSFVKSMESLRPCYYIMQNTTMAINKVIEDYYNKIDFCEI